MKVVISCIQSIIIQSYEATPSGSLMLNTCAKNNRVVLFVDMRTCISIVSTIMAKTAQNQITALGMA